MTDDSTDNYWSLKLLFIYFVFLAIAMCSTSCTFPPKVEHKKSGQPEPTITPGATYIKKTCPPGVGWIAGLCADADKEGGHLYCPGVETECSVVVPWCPAGFKNVPMTQKEFEAAGCTVSTFTCVQNCPLKPRASEWTESAPL